MSTSVTPRTHDESRARISTRTLVVAGLALSLVLGAVVSLFASASPDGLEYVAGSLGFDGTAQDSAVAGSPLADYGTSGVANEWLSGALAAVVGLALTGVIAFGLMRLLVRSDDPDTSPRTQTRTQPRPQGSDRA